MDTGMLLLLSYEHRRSGLGNAAKHLLGEGLKSEP